MIREKPTRAPEWMNASVTEPDWAIPATPPRGSHGQRESGRGRGGAGGRGVGGWGRRPRGIAAPPPWRVPPPFRRAPPSTDDLCDAAPLERPGDDQPLDLGGSLPDPVDAQLAEEPLRRVLAHLAAAGSRLAKPIGAAKPRLGREEIPDRRLRVDELG